MVQPTPAVIASHRLKRPEAFTREQFGQLMVKAHAEGNVTIVETACFLEPHASGLMHHNCLVRADAQYRWKQTAETLFQKYKVSVSFGNNVKTWQEGVVYGCVGSEHKRPEMLDKAPTQWVAAGTVVKLEEHVPRHMRQPGHVRKVKLTPLAFLELCRQHNVTTEDEAWALGTDLEEKGDKGLLAYLLENDVASALAKTNKARAAKETARRAKLTRLQILEECARDGVCKCSSPGLCFELMKDILEKNKMDGAFQKDVCDTLEVGRLKERNLCLLGSTNMCKSFLMKPLTLIYRTYERPDGGSHQLEELLDKELVFLNDFEYDEDAKKWCNWSYLKRFLEGGKLPVACPKNRGGNKDFTSNAPVFMTAPQEVSLWRGKKRDDYETEQMNSRIKYRRLTHAFEKKDRVEAEPCAHCGARFYLEGRSAPAPATAPATTPSASPASGQPAASSSGDLAAPQTPQPQPTTGQGMVQGLMGLKVLKDEGLLDTPEFQRLKAKVLRGD
jgi:hypothetical protein